MGNRDLVCLLVAAGIALACFALGYNFWQGKLLRFIAGNTAAYDRDTNTPKQRAIGKQAGILVIGAGAIVSLMIIWQTATIFQLDGLANIIIFVVIACALGLVLYAIYAATSRRSANGK